MGNIHIHILFFIEAATLPFNCRLKYPIVRLVRGGEAFKNQPLTHDQHIFALSSLFTQLNA